MWLGGESKGIDKEDASSAKEFIEISIVRYFYVKATAK